MSFFDPGPQILGGLLQDRPNVPEFKPISVQDSQTKAIAGNTASLPALKTQAADINTFTQNEIQRMLELAMPGYAKLRDSGTRTISDLVAGKIPGDVASQVLRNSASRSLYGGFGGTGMSRNLSARDLGLTSLDLIGKGLDTASRWIAAARTNAPTFDFSRMFVTPEFQFQAEVGERNAQFQHDWVENQLKAQYSVGTIIGQAIIKSDDQMNAMITSLIGSVAGGASKGMMA